MEDNSRPKIIVPRPGPRIRCPTCDEVLPISNIDRRIGKIPHHQRPDEPKYKCPASNTPLKREYFINS